MRSLSAALALVALIALGGWYWLTRPAPLDEAALDGLEGDAARGEAVFWAAGCASCHSAPDSEDGDLLLLAGGQRFDSPFGTFIAPNISPDPEHGIGNWDIDAFANAMLRGVSPEGRHYFPAFPYTAYARADLQDVADLWAYWQDLPHSDAPDAPHEIGFPFNIRRNLGVWKRLYMDDGWALKGELTPQETRGRYLAEALAHCGECHTPRDGLGGLDRSSWLAGATNPSGDGRIPDIRPGTLDWSASEIAGYLQTGFTPEFDAAGGSMAAVVHSLSKLPREDLEAIAAYLLRVDG